MEECNGKRVYRSIKEAKRVRNTRGHATGGLRVYYCKWCHGFHLTKMQRARSDTFMTHHTHGRKSKVKM